jgi:hypothetical protein
MIGKVTKRQRYKAAGRTDGAFQFEKRASWIGGRFQPCVESLKKILPALVKIAERNRSRIRDESFNGGM